MVSLAATYKELRGSCISILGNAEIKEGSKGCKASAEGDKNL
jgi:hypothetical protein